MAGLKVVALISGGKDSFFSILHCIANGHQVVALANLHPPYYPDKDAVEDTDSFMYQTIGHRVLPLYEQALGLPLYRQEIVGSAVNQDKSYGHIADAHDADRDETESLVPLLVRVKEAHPEINAVSTGAILSDYQRTRVESVAVRMGLVPLSYLWQWPSLPPRMPTSLLEDMAAVGQVSRIVKVASGGLDESFLWQDVANRRTIARLSKAAERYGSPGDGAVLGEGGEYETLAVQGPSPLWKAKIVIGDEARVVMPGEAGSSSLRLVTPRLAAVSTSQGTTDSLRVPPLLDDVMEKMLHRVLDEQLPHLRNTSEHLTSGGPGTAEVPRLPMMRSQNSGLSYFCRTGEGSDASSQTRDIMNKLVTELAQAGSARVSNIAYTSIILRDMVDFAAVNKVYGSYFLEPIPPARVTLACADVLLDGRSVMIGMTCFSNGAACVKNGLHVQSRSYWAPANIGPYSQAIAVPIASERNTDSGDLIYVAGQIPLEPASMEVKCSSSKTTTSRFAQQAVLALQHMVRIGNCMRLSAWVAAIAFVVVTPDENASALARIAHIAWHALHNPPPSEANQPHQAEDFDVWDQTHGRGRSISHAPKESEASRDGDTPPLWVLRVDALPRSASIEWVGYGTTSATPGQIEVEHLRYLLRTFRDRVI